LPRGRAQIGWRGGVDQVDDIVDLAGGSCMSSPIERCMTLVQPGANAMGDFVADRADGLDDLYSSGTPV